MNADRRTRRRSLRAHLATVTAASIGVTAMSLAGTETTSAQSQTPPAASSQAQAGAARPRPGGPKPTVVLVHGAWGDATGWDGVIRRLQRDGYPVLAPANPLRGLTSDAAYVASVLDTLPGPVVLVGHSYGGAVITNAAAGKANVKALVYVAAFALDQGEDVGTAIARFPGSQIVPPGLPGATTTGRPFPLPGGGTGIDVYINLDKFRQIFVADVPEAAAAVMAAAQRPASAALLQEKSGVPAWKTIPSWALVATKDNTIGTENVRFMAKRAGATIEEVDAAHAVLVSRPERVADLIRTAAGAVPAV